MLSTVGTIPTTFRVILYAFVPLVSSVIVSTKYGKIEGRVTLYPNAPGTFKSVNKFLGVPFASPPLGELRFEAPQPPREWKPKVRHAKKHGDACIQPRRYEFLFKIFAQNFSYSEDCLYLDVYTPSVSERLPVLVYIHGGAYETGTSFIYPGDILALQGVVVVVIQYRLGPFGFLTTGDSAAPGNFGMLDQVESLKWVKDNIENFGGNPSKVTIFGVSAGGTSVGLHLLSPLSKDLFHQAIAESGVDLTSFATLPLSVGVDVAKELAQKLNCPTDNNHEMMNCMRNKDAAEISKTSEPKNSRFVDSLFFAPVVDKNFLYDAPGNLRKNEDFKNVTLMIGFTSNEGSVFLAFLAYSFGLTQSTDDGVSQSYFRAFLEKLAHHRNKGKTANLIKDALELMYTPWPDHIDRYALRRQLVDLIGDYLFFAPSHKVADVHSKIAPVYMLEFAHRSPNVSFGTQWMGVAHGDNVDYDFGVPFLSLRPYTASDRNVSRLIMNMYANFARSGDPSTSDVMWERYNSSHRAYLRVDANPRMAASFNSRRMAFWNDYYPKLAQLKFQTKNEVTCGANTSFSMATFLQIVLIVILRMF